MAKKIPNPNGSSKWKADPRQALFLKYYLGRDSETFASAYKSAIKAGYEHEYAMVMISRDLDWISEAVKTEDIVQKAERNLDEFMDLKEDNKVRADMTKFVLTRLRKDKYSERKELTGAEGQALQIEIIEDDKSE